MRKLTTIASKAWRGHAGKSNEQHQRGSSSNSGRQQQSRDESVNSFNNIDNDSHNNDHNGTKNRQVGGEYLEVTLISAQGLKDVSKMFERMSPYAVVWVDPAYKLRTELAEKGGSSPVWDYCLRVPMGSYSSTSMNRPAAEKEAAASMVSNNRNSTTLQGCPREVQPGVARGSEPILTVEICNQGDISDALVGSATIPLRDVIKCQRNKTQEVHYMACQLMRPSGRIQGLLNLSLRYVSQSTPCSSSGASASAVPTSLRNAAATSESTTLQQNARNSWSFLSSMQPQNSGGLSQHHPHQSFLEQSTASLSQHYPQQSFLEQSTGGESRMDSNSDLYLGVAAAGVVMQMTSPTVMEGGNPALMQIGASSGVDVQQIVGNAAAMAGLAAYMSQAPSVSSDCSQLPPS